MLLLAFDDALEHLRELALRFLIKRLSRRSVLLACRRATVRFIRGFIARSLRLEAALRLFQTPSQRALLHPEDLVDALSNVLHDRRQIVAFEDLAPALTEPPEKLAETGDALPLVVLEAALEQPVKGMLEIAEAEQVVGDAAEETAGIEGWRILTSAPFGVAVSVHSS
jgi:hypothetical protein